MDGNLYTFIYNLNFILLILGSKFFPINVEEDSVIIQNGSKENPVIIDSEICEE